MKINPNNISFEIFGFRKNAPLIIDNDEIISEYNGNILKLRIEERKPPIIIGEFNYSIWNIHMGRMINADIMKIFNSFKTEKTYSEFIKLIENNHFNLKNYNRLLFMHNVIVHPDYRKSNITEELIENVFREFYDKKTAIMGLFVPIQYDNVNYDFYIGNKKVKQKNGLGINDFKYVSAGKYYELENIKNEKKDIEFDSYKLYSLAIKLNFERIENTSLFLLNNEKMVNKVFDKHKTINEI